VFVRSLASNIDEYPHTGATQYNDSFKIPAVAISTKQSEMISSALGAGKPRGYTGSLQNTSRCTSLVIRMLGSTMHQMKSAW
jgi:hypothetical protein